jgi:wyosine [tRNA(Phe)-imidazoG37] synthetase (radical SAM superfamily)
MVRKGHEKGEQMKIFGPVPSRRLGMSLGVNNIPYKICTYACVYCQIGKAVKMQATRQAFYPPEELLAEARAALAKTRDVRTDYLTIVPDGEPTLDINLGALISNLKTLGIPVAVITNSSLLHLQEVRRELAAADYVSVKIDAVRKDTWKRIDRPFKSLNLEDTLRAVQLFGAQYGGHLATETMLVRGINDTTAELAAIADFIQTVQPAVSYLSVPIRPPAVSTALPPDEATLNAAYQIFSERLASVEYLTGYEGNAFSSSGDAAADILGITAVHPMREDAVRELLAQTDDAWEVVEELLRQRSLQESSYNGHRYYLRKFTK